jgi:hypothetical protein
VDIAQLTKFDVDADGGGVELHLLEPDGASVTVVLPFACLSQLLMTLPNMIRVALRRRHGDDSLRLVYPIGNYQLEVSEADRDGISHFILSLQTKDGFSASFAASAEQLADIARSILEDVDTHPVGVPSGVRLS